MTQKKQQFTRTRRAKPAPFRRSKTTIRVSLSEKATIGPAKASTSKSKAIPHHSCAVELISSAAFLSKIEGLPCQNGFLAVSLLRGYKNHQKNDALLWPKIDFSVEIRE